MEPRSKAAMKATIAEVQHRAEEEGWHLLPTELLSRIFLGFELGERHVVAYIPPRSLHCTPSKVCPDRTRDVESCMPEPESLSTRLYMIQTRYEGFQKV